MLFIIEKYEKSYLSLPFDCKLTASHRINLNKHLTYFCNLLRNVRFRDICGIRQFSFCHLLRGSLLRCGQPFYSCNILCRFGLCSHLCFLLCFHLCSLSLWVPWCILWRNVRYFRSYSTCFLRYFWVCKIVLVFLVFQMGILWRGGLILGSCSIWEDLWVLFLSRLENIPLSFLSGLFSVHSLAKWPSLPQMQQVVALDDMIWFLLIN